MTATERAWGNAVNPAAALDQRYRKEIAELWTRIHELESAQPKWISVGDRLPELDEYVLIHWVVNGYSGVCGCSRKPAYDHEPDFFWNADRVVDVPFTVTHWRPLPEPPGEGE